LTKNKIILQL